MPAAGTGPGEPTAASRVHDVLVAGGGPAGLFLAVLLAEQGVDVAVLERRVRPSTHSRAIGLHPPALAALRRLGLEQEALAEGVAVRRGVARSRGRHLGGVTFERAWPQHPFVLTLPQQRTEALLARRLAELAPRALHRGGEVVEVREEDGLVHVRVAAPEPATGGAQVWSARVLVGADGARSVVRERAGIGTRLRLHRDTYLMGDVADTTGEGSTATIFLEPDGVVESFPLPGGVRRWVVHTGTTLVEPGPARLVELVRQRTGQVLDPGTSTMTSAFGVRRQLARTLVAGRQVLVGDAGHEISPIGGQGMTLGWLDAQALVPALVDLLATGDQRPLPLLPRFRAYSRTRLRAAGVAARQAELNMALGRPAGAPAGQARDVLVRLLLGTPARHPLAGAFTMRWA